MAATVHAQNASHKIEQEASHFKSNTKVCIDRLIEKAKDLVDSRADLGDERTLAMLDKCEAVLRDLISSEAAANALGSVNDYLSSSAPSTPDELEAGFKAHLESAASRQQAGGSGDRGDAALRAHPDARQLASLREQIAGGSGSGDHDDPVMTQQTLNFTCPILQTRMSDKGELRPMSAAHLSGHTPRCVFSHKGIHSWLVGSRRNQCPVCKTHTTFSTLKECKSTARQIRSSAHAADDDMPDATPVD
mmetsp:Transcript_16350/g.52446  ORF Transcript_16350/g.52446 Transcript_16350/m.52446 type:complete len:248 (-) Transcript_16350:365-1108(-)